MIGVSIRVRVKLLMFAFIMGFIFLFVVYGYRFDKATNSFVSQNVFMSLNFFSDDNTVTFDGNIYEPAKKQINFYNLDAGCFTLQFDGKEEKVCLSNNEFYSDSLVRYEGTKPYIKTTFAAACTPTTAVDYNINGVGKQSFAEPVESAFTFHEIAFLQVADMLYTCNTDFSRCKPLTEIKGDIVCGNKQGLVSYTDGKYELIQLK